MHNEEMPDSALVTVGHLRKFRDEFRVELRTELRTELHTELSKLRVELRDEFKRGMAILDANWDARFDGFKQEILLFFREFRSEMLKIADRLSDKSLVHEREQVFLSDRVTRLEERVDRVEARLPPRKRPS